MDILRFDRHLNMSSKTRSQILSILKDMQRLDAPSFATENMLFGFFDGYDYSKTILESNELKKIKKESPNLANRIHSVCYEVMSYDKE